MEKFYSKIEPNRLLHAIYRREDIRNLEGREDLVAPDQYIQCAALKLPEGTTFKPHKHNVRTRTWDVIAQESWHVIRGSVKCIFYDLDDTILAECVLRSEDTSFSFGAGHNYVILSPGTEVLEYKTGKYEGHDIDKTEIK